jgi:hypothetical protein
LIGMSDSYRTLLSPGSPFGLLIFVNEKRKWESFPGAQVRSLGPRSNTKWHIVHNK